MGAPMDNDNVIQFKPSSKGTNGKRPGRTLGETDLSDLQTSHGIIITVDDTNYIRIRYIGPTGDEVTPQIKLYALLGAVHRTSAFLNELISQDAAETKGDAV